MTDTGTKYTERSPWPGFATAILWGVVVLSSYPILAGWDVDLPLPTRTLIVAAIVGGAATLQLVVGGLTVKVGEAGILLHLGSVPLVRTFVPYEEISSLAAVRYRPLREFGGWGVRGGRDRRAWTARGDEAVELRLGDDRVLLIGSDHPQRLGERIRAAAAGRLAGT